MLGCFKTTTESSPAPKESAPKPTKYTKMQSSQQPARWNKFINTSPFQSDFMPEQYELKAFKLFAVTASLKQAWDCSRQTPHCSRTSRHYFQYCFPALSCCQAAREGQECAWIPPQELPCPLLQHHHIPALSPAQTGCYALLVWTPGSTLRKGALAHTQGSYSHFRGRIDALLIAKAMNNISAFSSSHALYLRAYSHFKTLYFKNTVFQSAASKQLTARSTATSNVAFPRQCRVRRTQTFAFL